MHPKPARANTLVLKQLLNFIPRNLLNRAASETGVEAKARTFSVLSHLATMLFAQLSHAISLNDVCDWLRLKAAALSQLRISPPSRNALAHANKVRSADFIETLFWSVLEHLQNIQPSFAQGKKGKGLLRRFKVKIHAVDSTVMELVANCIGWAKHRRQLRGEERLMVFITNKPELESALVVRPLPAALGHRGVFRTGQTDAEAEQFFGPQRQRRSVASTHGPVGVRAATLSGVFVRLGP